MTTTIDGTLGITTTGASANVLLGGLVSATGNVIGGNILTAGIISATGNATHGNILTSGIISSTGNATAGNILTAGIISSTGNATAGNILTAGIMSSTGNATHGNILTAGVVSGAGNVTLGTSGKYVRNTAGGVASPSARFALTTTSVLDVHINTSVNGNSASNTQQYGMSFSNGGGATQAAIVCSENGADGTSIGIFCTNSYATGPQLRAFWDPAGNLQPAANATYDLGSTTYRWKTIYTTDLELNNGIGDYTVVEGADDLFLYNNRSGKVFKFALIEVDPATAPPKAKR